jgi:hypothetical protein
VRFPIQHITSMMKRKCGSSLNSKGKPHKPNEGHRWSRQPLRWLLTLVLLTISTPVANAQAQAGNPVTGFFQGLCASTNAKLICDLSESLTYIDGFIANGAQNLQGVLGNLGQGFVQDAIQTIGGQLCAPNGPCLNDTVAGLRNLLETAPAEFFDRLYQEGSRYYLSNLVQKLNRPSTAQPGSPQYTAEEAMKTNPNLRAEMIGATSRDLRVFKDKTEVAKLAAQSAEVISLPKGQTDPFARHAQSLLMPATGFIDGYKDRAKTAVSSREVIQTLAELEADKAGLDLQNTLELSKRLQQVATVQVLTNNQLAKIHQAIISEQEQKSLEFQAALEEKLSSAYSDAAQSSATFGSAGSLMVQNTNSASFDGFLGRF